MKYIYYILLLIVNVLIFVGETGKYAAGQIIKLSIKIVQSITKFTIAKIRSIRLKLPSFSQKPDKKKKLTHTPITIKKKKIRKKKRPIRIFYIGFKYFAIGFITSMVLFAVYQGYTIVKSLPSPRNIGKINYSLSTHIYDRNGKPMYEIYREQNRTPVRLRELPAYVYQAAVAIEDKDFFNHRGVAWYSGIGRSIREFIVTKTVQGGSTITQQLVKSALLSPERTIERKLKEIILALWTERLYSKIEILEMYLNQVPYGGAAYGIEEAANTYFDKSAKDLTLEEAALLAGLPISPSIYSPFANPELAKVRRNDVLKNMFRQEYITSDQYKKAAAAPVDTAPPQISIKAPHFVFYVRNELDKLFGIRTVEEGGLNVVTSLDLTIQDRVEQILAEEVDKIRGLNVNNAAALVTKPATGEILAMAGSVDYFGSPSGAFNVVTALRQPGSSIKPVMYSLALAKGLTAASPIDDTPVSFQSAGAPAYRPVNYDGRFHGRVTLRTALGNSYNIPAVRTLNYVGVPDFIDHAKRMGITTWNEPERYGLSLTLGGAEVTMIDMARAYGVFANMGNKIDVTPISYITDKTDTVIFEKPSRSQRVLDPGISYIMSDILSDPAARQSAFGARSALEVPGYRVAVKTGTTDQKKDNWTIGYTPEYLVVVWVGNNDNTPMNPSLTSGITGAAPIWNRIMTYLLTSYSNKNSWFNMPEDVVQKQCGKSKEYFLRGTENKYCNVAVPKIKK